MKKWSYLTAAITSEVTATLALRASLDAAGWIVVAILGYVSAFAWLAAILRSGVPIGVAYGIWAALGVALTAVAATVIYGEAMSWKTVLGIMVIIAGVLMVELGSHVATSSEMTREELAS